MSHTCKSAIACALIGFAILVILGGCAFSPRYPILTFESSTSYEEKKEEKIRIDPENLEWIRMSCPNHRVVTNRKHREITPYGVVFTKIQCMPLDEARHMPPIGESRPVVEYLPTIYMEVRQ